MLNYSVAIFPFATHPLIFNLVRIIASPKATSSYSLGGSSGSNRKSSRKSRSTTPWKRAFGEFF